MDNRVSSESGDIKSGATSAICVPLLAGTVLFCALLSCAPVRIGFVSLCGLLSSEPLAIDPCRAGAWWSLGKALSRWRSGELWELGCAAFESQSWLRPTCFVPTVSECHPPKGGFWLFFEMVWVGGI